MKILVATPLYPPEIGGPATYVKMLERVLPEAGHELEVVTFASVRRWPKLIRHMVYYWKLQKLAKDVEVIFALDPVSVGLPARFAARKRRKPLLLRVPGDYAWEQGQIRFGLKQGLDEFSQSKRKGNVFVHCLYRLQASVARSAELVIVPSQYMKDIVATWQVHPARIVPIYSVLNSAGVSEGRAELRQRHSFAGTTITTVGRLVPWKGMMTLIELLPELRVRVPGAELVIVGDGPEAKQLEQKAAAVGVADHVRFLGRLRKETLAEVLVASDVFALNTAYEGLSHQVLEAMDLGVPVVTTNVGGNPEVIKDGVTGILVDYDDREGLLQALERAATHKDFTATMTANARLRVKDFAESAVTTELIGLLENNFTK